LNYAPRLFALERLFHLTGCFICVLRLRTQAVCLNQTIFSCLNPFHWSLLSEDLVLSVWLSGNTESEYPSSATNRFWVMLNFLLGRIFADESGRVSCIQATPKIAPEASSFGTVSTKFEDLV
jgi:hypothetical protein